MTESPKIQLSKIRELTIAPGGDSRPPYVYAASGLVKIGNRLYIVADDELQLALFELGDDRAGTWLRLMPGTLPVDYQERKKAKPDLESITHLPPYEFAAHGALLVVPSMSRKNRINGVLVPLDDGLKPASDADARDSVLDGILPVDFTAVREKLAQSIDELNVEGIAVFPDSIKLFHRGSKNKFKSAVVELDAKPFLKDLHDSHTIRPERIVDIREYDLGEIDGLALHFTDAVALNDTHLIFLATAEDTSNAYDDGVSRGSAVGVMEKKGKVERILRFEGHTKLEGVSARAEVADGVSKIRLLMVSDTDDQTKPACLFEASI